MKKIFICGIIILSILILAGCSNKEKISYNKDVTDYFVNYTGLNRYPERVNKNITILKQCGFTPNLHIYAFCETKNIKVSVDTGWIFSSGSFSMEGYDAIRVCWKKDNTYVFSTIPISKFQIKIDNTCESPVMNILFDFNYSSSWYISYNQTNLVNKYIEHKRFLYSCNICMSEETSKYILEYLVPVKLEKL